MLRSLCAFAGVAGLAASASATWSIVLIDVRTGEIAVGSATCLTNFDLQAGTPVLIPGVGAATAQSFVDQGGYNRVFIRDRLLEGVPPDEILALLEDVDGGHQTRQYGIADALGGVATFTGTRAGAWAGGVTGRIGDVVYAVQGNVLTGPPVVLETEQVIVSSIGAGLDLPETLMLAMDEARRFGGDGRCSCAPNDADGCGSPPDGWDPETGKSADIAYMLIARAGDGFGCNSAYRLGRNPIGVAAGDFNGDGSIDAVVSALSDSALMVLDNTDLRPPYVTFAPPRPVAVPNNPVGVVAVDIDLDGDLDLVYGETSQGRVGVSYNDGAGNFSFPGLTTVGQGAGWVAVGDLDGDGWPDVVSADTGAGQISVLRNDGTGRLTRIATIEAGASPQRVVIAELDGRPGLDLACTDDGDRLVRIFANDGTGGFTLWRTVETLATPTGLVAADFDGDGRTDLATADRNSRVVSVYRQTADGHFEVSRLGNNASYTALATADLDGDGLADLVATSDGPARLTVFLGRAGEDPVLAAESNTASPSNDLVLADFNGDGFLDALHNVRQSNGAFAVPGIDPTLGEGFFHDGAGCATSDYFMEFNIAFQRREDPDPVDQLQDLFDAWRSDLLGVTDAVRSRADADTDRLPVGSIATITAEPLDWRPEPVGPGLDLRARHAGGSAGLTELLAAVDRGDGTYTVEASAADLPPDARGVDLIEIVVEQAGRTVVLMPALRLTVTRPIADWNMDGRVDGADVDAFLTDWIAGEDETDLNGDGQVNTLDILVFVRYWAGN
jgi:hypothetical protein